MPTTIYTRLNDRDFVYSRNDLRKIAYWTHEKYLEANGKDPDKIEQEEEDKVFMVFVYPDEWIETIDQVTDWYFKKKRKIGEKHIKRELKAKEAKQAREKKLAEKEEAKQAKKNFNNKNKLNRNNNFNKNKGDKPFNKNQKNYKGNNQTQNNFNKNRNNNNRTNNQNSNYKPNHHSSNYKNRFTNNNPNQNVNSRQEKSSFSTFESDLGNDFKNTAGAKSTYLDTNNENKFNQKVEIEISNPENSKKRKRIAKALYVAAPNTEENE